MRYTYFFMTILISFSLAGSVFALYPIAAIITGLCYISDKYLLLHFHQISRYFNDEFHMAAFSFYMPLALLLHLVASYF